MLTMHFKSGVIKGLRLLRKTVLKNLVCTGHLPGGKVSVKSLILYVLKPMNVLLIFTVPPIVAIWHLPTIILLSRGVNPSLAKFSSMPFGKYPVAPIMMGIKLKRI
ncbi:hypothetical protein Ahia01_000146200 [Argonauta hians]